MNSTDKLLNWIKQRHEGQLIRRTTEPYINHLVVVAELASVSPLGYEVGLCHDLFEETETTKNELHSALTGFGYKDQEADLIVNCSIELTDVFTKKNYPDLKKKNRKKKEAERLATISPVSQTVKYADLIYNVEWVMKYDLKHAEKYLRKKQLLLAAMIKGNGNLHQQALTMVDDSLSSLLMCKG
jgi:hypothetical protein